MTVVELKEKLITQIKDTDNTELLRELDGIMDFESERNDIYILSPEELAAVKDGIEQIDNGQFFTNDEANKIFDKCLGK